MEPREVIGLVTVIVSGFVAYIYFLHREFKAERQAHASEREHRNQEWQIIAKESTQVHREHTNVLSRLATLLETDRR